jgi:NADH:ubiquinone oxidoreductase subunit H
MISYELVLSSAILIVVIISSSLNFTTIIENQQAVWYVVPLFPVFIFYFISVLAETSRTPFDLQEASLRFGLYKVCYMLENPIRCDNQQETTSLVLSA